MDVHVSLTLKDLLLVQCLHYLLVDGEENFYAHLVVLHGLLLIHRFHFPGLVDLLSLKTTFKAASTFDSRHFGSVT